MVRAIKSCLAIYSKFGGDYANSVRWTHQGGYCEMAMALFQSRKKVPTSADVAMIVTIIASFAASIASKGVTPLINPSEGLYNGTFAMISTPYFFTPFGWTAFDDWSTSIQSGADTIEAMVSLLSDTKIIRNATAGRVYTPRPFQYEVGCNRVNLDLVFPNEVGPTLLNNGCYNFTLLIDIPFDVNASSAAVTSVTNVISDLCEVVDDASAISSDLWNGLTSVPKTLTTKCVSTAAEIFAMSASSTRFSSSSIQQFHNASAAVFGESDELLQAMEIAINNATFTSSSLLLSEIRLVDTSIDVLSCYSGNSSVTERVQLMCLYTNTNIIMTKPQEINPIISEARAGRPFNVSIMNTMVTIDHIPTIVNGIRQPVPLSTLRNASIAASQYFASMGQNLYFDWDTVEMYALYDTMDRKNGFEVPRWLSICISASIAICTFLWRATEFFLDGAYKRSLYKDISKRIARTLNRKAPMLMRFSAPLKDFEGFPLISGERQTGRDTNSSKITLID
ncbi:hypothetical protein BGZ58_010702 [Dissophora ornata]|nr:hypothetical protein BGZ58_010702 [Dissophora ornata]